MNTKESSLIAEWCKSTDKTISLPISTTHQILQSLSRLERLTDKRITHLDYYYEQDTEKRKLMLESSKRMKEDQQRSESLVDFLRGLLIAEFTVNEGAKNDRRYD